MGLLDKLQSLGCQLKLVQVVPKTKTAPEKITTHNVTLRELTTQLHAENMRVLAESPVELSIAYDKVYETAGIKALSNGWSAEQLVKLLQSEPHKEMDRTALQKAVLEKLAAAKVTAEELIKDALAKDQALDAFETFVSKKMRDRCSARQMRMVEIEKEIAALRQEQTRLKQEDHSETLQLSEWQRKKGEYEKEILAAVDFLISCKDLASANNNTQ
jgi:hypothetical protein